VQHQYWAYRAECVGRTRPLALFSVCVLALGTLATVAHASDAPRALVICARCVTEADAAIEEEVRAALRSHEGFELLPAAPLDLEAVQLSIDCTDESVRCLREAAARLKARVLFVPAIDRVDGAVTLRLLYFDTASSGEPRSVSKRSSAKTRRGWSAQLPGMLRELLATASQPVAEPEPGEAPAKVEAPDEAPDADQKEAEPDSAPADVTPAAASAARDTGGHAGRGLPIGPIVLGGAGVAAVAAGIVVGVMMRDTEASYAARVVDSPMQAQLAEAERKRGQSQAVAATVFLGAGVAAIAVAGAWFAMGLREPTPPAQTQTALAPMFGPRTAGVLLRGSWEPSP